MFKDLALRTQAEMQIRADRVAHSAAQRARIEAANRPFAFPELHVESANPLACATDGELISELRRRLAVYAPAEVIVEANSALDKAHATLFYLGSTLD